MFCNSCGHQISDTAKFCNRCGAPTSGETVISNSTPSPEPPVFQNDYYPAQVIESAPAANTSNANGAKIAKYILLAFCILFTAIAQIVSLFSPMMKTKYWDYEDSVVDFVFDSDSADGCTSSCEDFIDNESYYFTPYYIDMYQTVVYFLIAFLVSAFAFTSMGRCKAIGIGKLITAFCCCITALIAVFGWNVPVKQYEYKVYPASAFYWVLVLYLGAVIVGIISNKMAYTPPVRTGYISASVSGGASLFSRAMPKHIHEEIICDNDYPTTSDFERLIYKANLRTHLADSTPSQRLFNSVNQHIYKAFYTATNRRQANSQMFTYNDKDNNIYGLITVNGRTLTIDLKINM